MNLESESALAANEKNPNYVEYGTQHSYYEGAYSICTKCGERVSRPPSPDELNNNPAAHTCKGQVSEHHA